ncbi:hypothetical protein RN001_005670 [Aquatica leii]|uniref:Uncharacterized protein n=1 Tax=Aquatica leii TaxID=1421715 RepID=A0AAN7PK75_9COLE|nr:hypothetical protein RN001_005670 [Aquatica leii]
MIQDSFQEDGQTETTLRNTVIDNSNDTAPGPTNADLLDAIKNLTKTVVHLQNSVDSVHQQLVNLEFAKVVNDEMTDHSLDIPKLPCSTIH